MQFNTYLKSKLPFYLALSSLFVLASCGSYQYVGYDNDGIYAPAEEVSTTQETVNSTSDQAYYKGYFAEKSEKYQKIANDENVIFTDIDSYEGTYNDVTGEVEYDEGYAGWGQNSDNVTINVYDNSWAMNPWAFGYYSPWGWNNFGYGWASPWARSYWGYHPYWGWNTGWGYGYNNWAWNSGFGWCAPYYGYGGYYGYHHNNLAYNTTRRGGYAYNQGRNAITRSNNRYEGRNTTRRNSVIRNSNSSRYNPANSVRSNNRSSIINRRSNSNTRSNRSNTRINRPTSNTRSNTRVNSPTRSTTRSSAPSTSRGSSSTRSSSSRGSGGSSSRRGG